MGCRSRLQLALVPFVKLAGNGYGAVLGRTLLPIAEVVVEIVEMTP